jgi:hypothetical protein
MKPIIFRADNAVNSQQWISAAHKGVRVILRFDEKCKNGHSTFSITGEVIEGVRVVGGGCIHDKIAKVFPKLACLIPWHLCSTDGPMHYVANTIYLAGDRDCNGLRKGEQKPLLGPDRVPHWRLVDEAGGPIYALKKDYKGDTPPDYVPQLKWVQKMITGEGKEPNLEAARACASWPDATQEQLCSKEALSARLPDLLVRFRAAMDSCGFAWDSKECS